MSKKSRRRQEQLEEKDWTLSDPGSDLFALLTQGAVTSTGVAVGPESAMRVPAVAAAVRTIAETIASLPIHLFKRSDGGGRERDRSHAAAKVLERPAPWVSAYEFKLRLVMDAIQYGRGIAVAARGDGHVRELHRIAKGLLRVEHDRSTGEPSYIFAPTEDTERRYDWADVVDVVPVPSEGEPPSLISLAREAIGFAVVLQNHGARLFANGARPSGLLSFEGNLSANEIRNRIAAWNAAHGGEKSGGTAAMDRKASYTALALSSVDAQYLDLWRHAILEIARVFRVPPHMVSELGRATFSNTEELGLQFIAYTLRPWLDLIEGALTRVLLKDNEREEYFLEFVLDDLTRGNIIQRFAALKAAVGGPFLLANEARALENRQPIAGGEKLNEAQGAAAAREPIGTGTGVGTGEPETEEPTGTLRVVA